MGKKEIKPQPKRILSILIVGIAVLGSVTICVVSITPFREFALDRVAESELVTNECDAQVPSAIESYAEIELPPSYRNLETNCMGINGYVAEAKFEMTPDELDLFLATTDIEQPLSSSNLPANPHSNYLKRDAEDVAEYLYGVQAQLDWIEEIVVETSQPNLWIVYFTVVAG